MKHIVILLFFLLSQLSAKDLIKGIVKSEGNLKPLELANIFLKGTAFGTTSNKEGVFELSASFKEDDILSISYLGYITEEIKLSDLGANINEIILSPKVLSSQSVLVESAIAKKGESPVTFDVIERKDIEANYTIQDIPEYLSTLPSTTFYSEGGNGIGYNYLSIRGFDQRRVSVSINGIPQNDPEDHNVYWIDLPDILESTGFIQVQRGAGAGVVGYPSVGGAINIITSPFSNEKKIEISSGVGSYNTRKYTASFSSGLIDNKYSIYAKIGQVQSSGYRDRSWSRLSSYNISAVRYDKNITTQINIYGGPLEDGLVYNGVAKFAIKDRDLRKENLSWWGAADNEYLYKGVRRAEEIENFSQPHLELLNEFNISESVTLNSALFLIIGNGFFDYDGSWGSYSYFRLTPENGFDVQDDLDNTFSSNALIRARVENKHWGWIPRLSIKHDNGQLIIGGELRFHNSVHWGSIIHGDNLPTGVTRDYRYYYYEGGNDIMNFFVNENWKFNEQLSFLAEAQLAYHNYKIANEKYLDNEFEFSEIYLNPRVGVNYKFTTEFNTYLAFARVTREPRLKNYYDAAESSGGALPNFRFNSDLIYDFEDPIIEPETMNDFELGATYQNENYSLTANFFYMQFTNEIVKNGHLDRFGQPMTGNMEETLHTGIELSGSTKLSSNLDLVFNATYSKNYIVNGIQYLDEIESIDLSDNSINGFPEMIANLLVKYNQDGFYSQLTLKYVGDYYSDNYSDELNNYLIVHPDFVDYTDNKVDSYFVANAIVSYEFMPSDSFGPIKIFGQVNNIFDNLYAAHAVGKEYFPAAERNFFVGMKLGL
ncbi:MAG: TonB-dependent receptor [Bacteroidetes bacterium]|nr:TonB-dependent receptor [Bacteroidota bacterium]